jgi:hypothetical protein
LPTSYNGLKDSKEGVFTTRFLDLPTVVRARSKGRALNMEGEPPHSYAPFAFLAWHNIKGSF